mmetsp:Transcript_3593/g.6175  ORF Transcript_3593/g.6175 Transcript_3593/m.6175 type:complete len:203 (+) Transcript_3593:171-779(+)
MSISTTCFATLLTFLGEILVGVGVMEVGVANDAEGREGRDKMECPTALALSLPILLSLEAIVNESGKPLLLSGAKPLNPHKPRPFEFNPPSSGSSSTSAAKVEFKNAKAIPAPSSVRIGSKCAVGSRTECLSAVRIWAWYWERRRTGGGRNGSGTRRRWRKMDPNSDAPNGFKASTWWVVILKARSMSWGSCAMMDCDESKG